MCKHEFLSAQYAENQELFACYECGEMVTKQAKYTLKEDIIGTDIDFQLLAENYPEFEQLNNKDPVIPEKRRFRFFVVQGSKYRTLRTSLFAYEENYYADTWDLHWNANVQFHTSEKFPVRIYLDGSWISDVPLSSAEWKKVIFSLTPEMQEIVFSIFNNQKYTFIKEAVKQVPGKIDRILPSHIKIVRYDFNIRDGESKPDNIGTDMTMY